MVDSNSRKADEAHRLENAFLYTAARIGCAAGGEVFLAASVFLGELLRLALQDQPVCLSRSPANVLPVARTNAFPELRLAASNALREAVVDIGGGGIRHCFMEQGVRPGVPIQAVYPLSGGRNLWHTRDVRAGRACASLKRLLSAFSGADAWLKETDLPRQQPLSFEALTERFFHLIVEPHLEPDSAEIPDFHVHLRTWVLPRALYHLGYTLTSRVYAHSWRGFCILLLQCLFPWAQMPCVEELRLIPSALAEGLQTAGTRPFNHEAGFDIVYRLNAEIAAALLAALQVEIPHLFNA